MPKVGTDGLLRKKPDPLPNKVLELVKQLEEMRKSRVFLFVTEEAITPDLVDQIYTIRETFKAPTLDLLIDSGGGHIDSTYKLVKLMRTQCDNLNVLVPEYAKSAATFLCLGADTIYMSDVAELGPLDAQIPDPRDKSNVISALDAFKTLEFLRQYAMETLDLGVKLLLSRSNMEIADAIKQSREIVGVLMTPLYNQVNPLDLGEYSRILAIGEEYGKRIMQRYGYSHLQSDQIDTILSKIIWSFPSHSFVIDYEEARELGLNMHKFNTEQENVISEIMDEIDECIGVVT